MQALIHSRFFFASTCLPSCDRKTKLMHDISIVFSRPYSQFEIVNSLRCVNGAVRGRRIA